MNTYYVGCDACGAAYDQTIGRYASAPTKCGACGSRKIEARFITDKTVDQLWVMLDSHERAALTLLTAEAMLYTPLSVARMESDGLVIPSPSNVGPRTLYYLSDLGRRVFAHGKTIGEA